MNSITAQDLSSFQPDVIPRLLINTSRKDFQDIASQRGERLHTISSMHLPFSYCVQLSQVMLPGSRNILIREAGLGMIFSILKNIGWDQKNFGLGFF